MRVRRALAVAGALLAVAAAVIAVAVTRVVALPAPGGPHEVEGTIVAWTDSSRLDLLAPDSTRRRSLVAWVWRPKASLAKVPVLVFSPGLGVPATAYSALLAEIASHGYMVVAVAHPYVSPLVPQPDGPPATPQQARARLDFVALSEVTGGDVVSAVEHVVRESGRPDGAFAQADTARIGAFGHSFGGASAAYACEQDARIKAAMDLDGSLYGDPVVRGVTQPFFIMLADIGWQTRFRADSARFTPDRDQAYMHEQRFFEKSPTAYWLTVGRLRHMAFADEGYNPGALVRMLELLHLVRGPGETQALAKEYVLAFFGRYLRSDESRATILKKPAARGLSIVSHGGSG